jgi:hypothetical protein
MAGSCEYSELSASGTKELVRCSLYYIALHLFV